MSVDGSARAKVPWRFLFGLWAVSRLVAFGPIAVWSFGQRGDGGFAGALSSALRRWDAAWLLDIAADGYRRAEQAAFLPAFPTLVGALAPMAGGPLAAAIVANSVVALIAAAAVYLCALESASERAARLSAAIVLLHPVALFLSVPYTEALFLAASAGALWLARRNRPLAAGGVAAIAALTRNTGILLVLPLAVVGWRHRAGAPRTERYEAAMVTLPLAAIALWAAWLGTRFGDPLLVVTAQRHWADHLHLAVPLSALLHEVGRWRAWVDHHLPLTLLALWLTWRLWRARDSVAVALVAPPLLLSLSLSKLAIAPRLQLVLFPLWIELARWLESKPRIVTRLALGFSTLAGSVLAWRFAAGGWVD